MTMTSKDIDDICRTLHVQKRRKVIKSLLAGNDTQCFTTMQYAERMFDKIPWRDDPYWQQQARRQLLEEKLVEVSSDVWRMS
jgi:hypothetical protein